MQHALDAGHALIEAKALVAHGQWLQWLSANTQLGERIAQKYMRVARDFPRLTANTPRVADLSFREGLRLLTTNKDDAQDVADQDAASQIKPLMQTEPEWRQHAARHWWDVLARYTLLHDAMGWSVEQIADFWGVTAAEVSRILSPAPPVRFDTDQNGAELADSEEELELLRQVYAETVQETIAGMLRVTYWHAAHAADREPEFRHLKGEMEALERFHRRQAKRLDGYGFFTGGAGEQFGSTLWCCCLTDARAALGIEAQSYDGDLTGMVAMFRAEEAKLAASA